MVLHGRSIFWTCMVFLIISCSESFDVLGRYVYLDSAECIHADKDCLSKLDGDGFNSREAQHIRMSGVAFVDTADLYKYKGCPICPRCVTDEIYDDIRSHQADVVYGGDSMAVVDELDESKIPCKRTVMPLDRVKLKEIYNTLRDNGYQHSYENFESKFSGDSNYAYRKKVYDLMAENGAVEAPSYEDWIEELRFVQSKSLRELYTALKKDESKIPCKRTVILLDRVKLKEIYNTLLDGGYEQSYEEFERAFEGNNYANRKKVYDLLAQNGYVEAPSYEDWMKELHFVQSKSDMVTLGKLYTALKKDGAKLPEWNVFKAYLTAPGTKGVRHRQMFYDALKADGVKLPDTYDAFSRQLFAPKQ